MTMKLGLTVKVSLLPATPKKKKKKSARTLQSQWNFPKEKKKKIRSCWPPPTTSLGTEQACLATR